MKHTNFLRKCNTCGKEAHTEEQLELFEKDRSGKYGRRNRCRSCKISHDTAWREANPELVRLKSKTYHANKVYGISLEEYDKCMATSDCCEVCGSVDNLAYDHCHDTMDFRGVLCNKCNRSIGQLGDTLESLEKVVSYLRRASERQY
jgi:hypothetical protein